MQEQQLDNLIKEQLGIYQQLHAAEREGNASLCSLLRTMLRNIDMKKTVNKS